MRGRPQRVGEATAELPRDTLRSIRHSTARTGLHLITAGLVIGSLPALARIARTIPLRVPLDANEGWNAYHAVAAFDGALYPHSPRFFFNNYPPLSFFIVGAVSRIVGDPIVAGRLVALAAFAALAAILGYVAKQMRCSTGEAAFAAALFVATTLSLSHYVGIDDPQFLGQAIAAASLIFILPEPRTGLTTRSAGLSGPRSAALKGPPDRCETGSRTWSRLWIAAALMAAGVFIKHNVIALPLASIVWLSIYDRAAARRLAVSLAVIGIAGFVLCVWWFGPGFIEGLATPRGYSLTVLARAFVRWIIRVPVFIAAAALLGRRYRDPHVTFCVVYATLASVVGLVFLGGDGVDWNVMFESNWAWCLTAAVALNRAPVSQTLLALAFVLLPLVAGTLALRRARALPEYDEDIAFIAGHSGRAMCENLALCFWAGKPAEVDVVNLQQHVKRGSRSIDELLRSIDERSFSVVQVNDDSLLDLRARAQLGRWYIVARHGAAAGTLLVPAPVTEARGTPLPGARAPRRPRGRTNWRQASRRA